MKPGSSTSLHRGGPRHNIPHAGSMEEEQSSIQGLVSKDSFIYVFKLSLNTHIEDILFLNFNTE